VRITPDSRVLPPGGVIVRQAVWIGLYVVMAAWLHIPARSPCPSLSSSRSL